MSQNISPKPFKDVSYAKDCFQNKSCYTQKHQNSCKCTLVPV